MSRSARTRHPARAAACLLFALGSLAAASSDAPAPFHGALARQVNLYDLGTMADTIVHAHVLSTRVEPHPVYRNITTVVVTLLVEDSLKGGGASHGGGASQGGTLQFRQFLWDPRDRAAGGGYRKGQELLLFLTRPSVIGLSAPVGLDQGRIPLERSHGGAPAVGGAIADRLMQDFAPSLASRGIVLPAQEKRILARAAGQPLSINDVGSLVREINRPAPLSPFPAAPEQR